LPEVPPDSRPIVVAGAHGVALRFEVEAVPREGETVLAHSVSEPEDGGKATNQAVAAAKLGAPVRVLTLVGDDERGRWWRDRFEWYGLDTRFVIEAAGPTDTGVVLLPPNGIPAIVSTLQTGAALDAAAVEARAAAFDGASFVVCQLEAPQSCAVAAFRLAHAAGARTIFNVAPFQPLEAELLPLTDILVANEHEAAALVGRDDDVAALAADLGGLRAGWTAIVTAGAVGCFISIDGHVDHVPAPQVTAVDTTGAGDQFIGALAVRLRAGDSMVDAARYAVGASALSVTQPGTMPTFATPELLASTFAAL
jgi:ribokinase